jgi:hypothetical protein
MGYFLAGGILVVLLSILRLGLRIRSRHKPQRFAWQPDIDEEKLRTHQKLVTPRPFLRNNPYGETDYQYKPPTKRAKTQAIKQNKRLTPKHIYEDQDHLYKDVFDK